jgi:hypothetical protein
MHGYCILLSDAHVEPHGCLRRCFVFDRLAPAVFPWSVGPELIEDRLPLDTKNGEQEARREAGLCPAKAVRFEL